MNDSPWGAETQFFYDLTPDRILDAFERSTGLRSTGRCLALNSMENRVYEIEIETEEKLRHPWERFRILKFYRPGRWNENQILDEHRFLQQLCDDEIPAVAPQPFLDGKTLHLDGSTGLWYTVFPKVGGRSPYELDEDQLKMCGRLLARLHSVGGVSDAEHRVHLTPDTYGRNSLSWLLEKQIIPIQFEKRYEAVVTEICDRTQHLFEKFPVQRIHGDCHLGNLLWGDQGPFWVDFDDMVMGQCVQDLWLMIAGRDEHGLKQMSFLLEGYEQMRDFSRESLALIEPLRALRFVHFNAWISKRWEDKSFQRAFPQYETIGFWQEQVSDLDEQLRVIENNPWRPLMY